MARRHLNWLVSESKIIPDSAASSERQLQPRGPLPTPAIHFANMCVRLVMRKSSRIRGVIFSSSSMQ